MFNKQIKMTRRHSLILGILLTAITFHRSTMIAYATLGEYAMDWLYYISLGILLFIMSVNPVLILCSVYQLSRARRCQLLCHFLWLFPVLLVFANVHLVINPRILQRLLACTGVRRMSDIAKIVVQFYYGNLAVVCLAELFSYLFIVDQAFGLVHNTSIIHELLIWTSFYLIIYIFFMCFCCRINIIVPYLSEFAANLSLKERIIQPQVFKLNEAETSLVCVICLEYIIQEQDVAYMPNCAHAFHFPCLEQWLDCKEECPVCRGI